MLLDLHKGLLPSIFYNTHKYGPKVNVLWTQPLTSDWYIAWLSVTG